MASGWIPRGASRAKGNVVSVVFIFALVSIFVLSGCGGSSSNAHTGPRVLGDWPSV